MVEFLAGLAGDGRRCRCGPGIRVEWVDASAPMAERLRAKPGGESVPVAIGDMAQVPVSGRFRNPATPPKPADRS
jgi:hypothetical protein